ncbi:unnamed protein product [Pseudo-nitzschia multistriata]|uniref:DUF1329 domain-containing protein n=1 Tax=Pseudo-nitzschia multistriata TaxID=183589 RepID=A0A448Z7S4_9STRA|nr:unnamed protein product [Pseudo-nitzschia multistriata]
MRRTTAVFSVSPLLAVSLALVALAICGAGTTSAFTAPAGSVSDRGPSGSSLASTVAQAPPAEQQHWMDFMKFGGTSPGFDVIEQTRAFSECKTYDDAEGYFDEDYVFRGPIVGPITAKDVRETQERFNVMDAYPDLVMEKFGYTVDPENPYRCYWFERWKGTNREAVQVGPLALPPTGQVAVVPTHVMSANWTPSGKIIYLCLSGPLDRFEGNTMGQGAVFGLLKTAGVPLPVPSVGNPSLSFNQKYVAPLISQKAFSADADVPGWWKSTAKGADANDV